jgi:hypothetical protein
VYVLSMAMSRVRAVVIKFFHLVHPFLNSHALPFDSE